MDALMLALQLIGGLFLLLMNGFFVVTEFSMTRVRQFSESEFRGTPALERAWEMTERLEIYLSGCQVGITIASVTLGVVAEPAVTALLSGAAGVAGIHVGGSGGGHSVVSAVLALAIVNLLHIIVGEQAPTYLGVERTKWVVRYCAPILYYWTKVTYPAIKFADWAAKGLLSLFGVSMTRSWTEDGEDEGELSRGDVREEMGRVLSQTTELDEERRTEVMNALDIGETPVADILVPAEEVLVLSNAAGTDQTLQRIRENPQHVRYPLVGDGLDDLIGFVYAPTVLCNLDLLETGERTFADISTPPLYVDAELTISDLIDTFQHENQEIALVERDGDIVGLVTASDAFEAITGDLKDPLDLGANASS